METMKKSRPCLGELIYDFAVAILYNFVNVKVIL